MDTATRDVLRRQFDIAWALLDYHLQTLDTAECLWRPAERGPHVQQAPGGSWQADWPDQEGYSLGPPSIAWLSWHIDFWWAMTLNHHAGDGRLRRVDVVWPGSADGVRTVLSARRAEWLDLLEPPARSGRQMPREAQWPFRDRPFADVVAWLNLELMKNAAEIGNIRFLHGVRPAQGQG